MGTNTCVRFWDIGPGGVVYASGNRKQNKESGRACSCYEMRAKPDRWCETFTSRRAAVSFSPARERWDCEGETGLRPARARDDHAFKRLQALLVTFFDLHLHSNGIARRKVRKVSTLRLRKKFFND